MRRAAALVALLALAFASNARADASLLAASAASTLGAQASANLVKTPHAGLGVFYTRWNSQDYGTFSGYGGRLGWNIYGPLGLEARGSYLKADEDQRKTTLIPLEAALTLCARLGNHLAPYVGGGVGYYMKDAEFSDTDTWSSSENVAGYFGLAGLNLYFGAFCLFAEAKYTLVGTSDDLDWRGSDVEAQNSLDGPAYSAGLKLGF
jgi:hypothetical protein